ncbi:uncharacterized protein LOC114539013 [Dendronephthya gigantea]|uniref:uncharacterized protein LOC114539013 n=1 Tax=Dendronephthya gigantea TaxID=151771 RepID=UPI001068FB08|nr:uncharacterized protein LOC114539013 [Dendronephthya gigantea]
MATSEKSVQEIQVEARLSEGQSEGGGERPVTATDVEQERNKSLEEFKKELSVIQQLTRDLKTESRQVEASKAKYEDAFHKFVISHERYMEQESDQGKRNLMTDSYNNQRDLKLQIDCVISMWEINKERFAAPPSEFNLSVASRMSRRSKASSSRSSAKERRKAIEEVKLKMEAMKKKHELERQLEVTEQAKVELNRKLNLLAAETELKQAEMDFVIDQVPEEEGMDGMNAYLQDHQMKKNVTRSEVLPQDENNPAQENPVALDPSTKEFIPRPQPQEIEAWNSIAQAIREGPSLPKIELLKFSGDPLEYAEFTSNFKDNIEAQVLDEGQRFTRLLAQCVGKAREAIRSCVNLEAGTRYKEAKECLLRNFGKSHMIVEAHLEKIKGLQIRKADASALMEFVRHLEDSERTLKSMGSNYSNRLDNEDIIIMLMRKLPEENLKRKWADKAGDLIQTKGIAQLF